MVFYKDKNNILWEIDENMINLYDPNDIIIIDDSLLSDAFYPFFKLDENGNIIPDDNRILEKAKKVQSQIIKDLFNTTINEGYTCSNGIKLFATFDDIQKYKAGLELNQKLGQTETYIKDYYGVYHQITIDDLDKMIVELGLFYMQNWQKQGDLLDKINQATTLDDVLAVKWETEDA